MTNSRSRISFDYFKSSDNSFTRIIGQNTIYFRPIKSEIVTLDTPIFRYLSLDKLLAMLDRSELYVCNRKYFSDLQDKNGHNKVNSLESLLRQIEPAKTWKNKKFLTEQQRDKEYIYNICISCWSMDLLNRKEPSENFLMWKAYKSSDLMCRIGTTIRKLISNINPISNVIVSDVVYGECNLPLIDKYIFNKSEYYIGENEIRLAFIDATSSHIAIPITDINDFIESITLSPFINPILESWICNGMSKRYKSIVSKLHKSSIIEYSEV